MTFRIRFNTLHGDTDFFWRVIVDDGTGESKEHLARSVVCQVPTWSDASFDKNANAVKYHMAGKCMEFVLDAEGNALLR